MELDEFIDVDIRHAVSVGDHEAIGIDVLRHAFKAAALERFLPRVAECHAPVFDLPGMGGNVPALQINGIIRVLDVVIVKVLLNHLALVAEGQNKVLVAKAVINFHDVPENRASADFNHRFRFDRGFLAQSRALAAAHDDYFHGNHGEPPVDRIRPPAGSVNFTSRCRGRRVFRSVPHGRPRP